jgi:hypothetical protein
VGVASIRTRPPSTVWALLTQWYGSWLKTRRVINDFTIAQTALRICTADPSRVLLSLTNWSANTIAFGENRNITATTGLALAAGTTVTIEWLTDLDLQTTEIWAISAAGSNPLHVVESLLVGEFEGTSTP